MGSVGLEEEVILVDEFDQVLGRAEKLEAHRRGGMLHRAFSIFLFNTAGELLLQRRAPGKYHFGGLWTNSCCGHPRPGEELRTAAQRRLREELGVQPRLQHAHTFRYHAVDAHSEFSEHEIDHIFTGCFQGQPRQNAAEFDALRWISPGALRAELEATPERFTPWLLHVARKIPALARRAALADPEEQALSSLR